MKIMTRGEYRLLNERIDSLWAETRNLRTEVESLKNRVHKAEMFEEHLVRRDIDNDYSMIPDTYNLYALRSILGSITAHFGLEIISPDRSGYRVKPIEIKKK